MEKYNTKIVDGNITLIVIVMSQFVTNVAFCNKMAVAFCNNICYILQ